jgi:hypothetical protein
MGSQEGVLVVEGRWSRVDKVLHYGGAMASDGGVCARA